jgi:hypothetical protein
LRPIIACPAGRQLSLPAPSVPGRQTDLHPGGGQRWSARGGPSSAPGRTRAPETAGQPQTKLATSTQPMRDGTNRWGTLVMGFLRD